MSAAELKACPFCGGSAIQSDFDRNLLTCGNNKCCGALIDATHDEWNRRASPVSICGEGVVAVPESALKWLFQKYRDLARQLERELVAATDRATQLERELVAATDRATQAERALEEIRGQMAWIPVSERLPDFEQWVLVHNGKWTGVGAFFPSPDAMECWQSESREFIELLGPEVTHWKPLDAPPLPAQCAKGEG